MILEGRRAGLFSNNVELFLNGRSLGVVRGRWFSEGMDIDLGEQRVRFEKVSWLRSHFVMKDGEGNELGSAKLAGVFRHRWDLELKSGPGSLARAGFFTNGFELTQGSKVTARVNVTGWFTRRWRLTADDSLPAEDVLLIGLVYVTLRERAARES